MTCHFFQIYNTFSQEKKKQKQRNYSRAFKAYLSSLRMIYILRIFWKTIEDRSKI